MDNQQVNSKDFLIGAALGGILGTVVALLTAPKSGRRLRQDIVDTYEDLTDQTSDMAGQVKKKSRTWIKGLKNQTSDWTDKARESADDAACYMKGWACSEDHVARDLLIGSIAGGVLGALAGLLLAPKAGSELRQDIVDAYEDMSERAQDLAYQAKKQGKGAMKNVRSQANDWVDLAKQVVDYLSDEIEETTEEVVAEGRRQGSRIQDAAEWASLGFRLWQGMKKRR